MAGSSHGDLPDLKPDPLLITGLKPQVDCAAALLAGLVLAVSAMASSSIEHLHSYQM